MLAAERLTGVCELINGFGLRGICETERIRVRFVVLGNIALHIKDCFISEVERIGSLVSPTSWESSVDYILRLKKCSGFSWIQSSNLMASCCKVNPQLIMRINFFLSFFSFSFWLTFNILPMWIYSVAFLLMKFDLTRILLLLSLWLYFLALWRGFGICTMEGTVWLGWFSLALSMKVWIIYIVD